MHRLAGRWHWKVLLHLAFSPLTHGQGPFPPQSLPGFWQGLASLSFLPLLPAGNVLGNIQQSSLCCLLWEPSQLLDLVPWPCTAPLGGTAGPAAREPRECPSGIHGTHCNGLQFQFPARKRCSCPSRQSSEGAETQVEQDLTVTFHCQPP